MNIKVDKNISKEFHKALTKEYEDTLHPKIIKDLGLYYTDTDIAQLILEYIEADPEGSLFDPWCGTGSFVHAAMRMGFNKAYGADINEGGVKIFQKSTGSKGRAVKKVDTITGNVINILKAFRHSYGFDYVIGCPPYVHKYGMEQIRDADNDFGDKVSIAGKNLFAGAILKCMDFAKSSGVISIIVPKLFLNAPRYKVLRKMILSQYTIHSIISLGKIYKNFQLDMVVITMGRGKPKDNDIKIAKLVASSYIEDLYTIKQWFYKDEIILFESDTDKYLYDRLSKFVSFEDRGLKLENNMKKFAVGKVGRLIGRDIDKFKIAGFEKEPTLDCVFINADYSLSKGITAAQGLDVPITCSVVTIETRNVIETKVILATIQSSLYNYFYKKFVLNNGYSPHFKNGAFNSFPFIDDEDVSLELYQIVLEIEKLTSGSPEWMSLKRKINDIVYKYFSLSSEEINVIEVETKNSNPENWGEVKE